MSHSFGYASGMTCSICGETFEAGQVAYVCDKHGDDGNLDIVYDYDAIQGHVREKDLVQGAGMWRYKPLLPLALDAPVPSLNVGATPLYQSNTLATESGVGEIWVKDDGRNPTGSLKDRASALVVARAMAEGREIVTTASTGNAAAALAGLAASVGMQTVIFVPANAPPAKITQLLVYGARVLLVEGTYDDAFDLCLQATREFGWYCRNTGYNPYTAEGKKTVSYEISEQLAGAAGRFEAPDRIFVSVGDGNIISGVHKGFKDLMALGWIERTPRLMGVQAEGSSALYRAWQDGTDALDITPIKAQTIADSISAGLPRDRVRAMRAVRETGGAFVQVSDGEILTAIPKLAQQSGVFAEPAAAAAYAGLLKASQQGMLAADERIVVLITGNGLKDIAAAQKSVDTAPRIKPELSAVAEIVRTWT